MAQDRSIDVTAAERGAQARGRESRSRLTDLEHLVLRHRTVILDVLLLACLAVLGPLLALRYDFFHSGTGEQRIEPGEALLVDALLVAVAVAIFTTRRYFEQRRESARRAAAEQEIRRLAFQDVLTGLPNRRQFDAALQGALDSPPRAQSVHALLLLDLNGFKQVNDLHGHGVGDEVLIVVARRLLTVMREGDVIARLGGDEFAILAQHLLGAESATSLALRVIDSLDAPIVIGRRSHRVGVAIGIALAPGDATTREDILRKADVALYWAKAERRSALRFFEPQMDHHIQEREDLERQLREAVIAGGVRAAFDPSIDLMSGGVVGFEVLARWIHPEWGEMPPQRFIPVAEGTGLIHLLFEHLLREGCATAARWPAHVRLAIDLWPGQMHDKGLPARILGILAEHAIAAPRLELEVAESVLVQDVALAESVLGPLRNAGVRITLDHFGTGYSTLYHLRKCKLDKVKIDPVCVVGIGAESEKARFAGALVGLGQGLGLTVAATGIQSASESTVLADSGCREGQGAWVAAAVSAEGTLRFFQAGFLRADSGAQASRAR